MFMILLTRATIVIVGISECRARTMSSISFKDCAVIRRSAIIAIFSTGIGSGTIDVNRTINSFFVSTSGFPVALFIVVKSATEILFLSEGYFQKKNVSAAMISNALLTDLQCY